MICRKCSAEYGDENILCPECGEKNTALIQDEGLSVEENREPLVVIHDDSDEGEIVDEASVDGIAEAQSEAVAEKDDGEKFYRAKIAGARKNALKKKKMEEAQKKSNKASLIIALTLCAVGVICILLTVFRVKTDAFKSEAETQKAVALSKLSAEEEATLEKELALYYSALKTDFNSDECDAESFISRINPADTGNLYTVLNSAPEQLQTTADPAMRFSDEYGNYSYFKIPQEKINLVLERFKLSSEGDVNTQNCYYYDGFYYFNNVVTKATPVVMADVTKSKKVLDGSYYAECYFYVTDGVNTVKSDTYYLVVETNENALTDGYSFKINKANDEELFNSVGNPTKASGVTGYTMEKKVIEGRATDGTLYSRYVLEYPVFSGTSVGENSINEFFKGTVSVYEAKASGADEDYKSFVSKGGNVQELPVTETVVTLVTYSDDDKISFVEKISSYSPEIPVKQEETTNEADAGNYGYSSDRDNAAQTAQQEAVKLPVRTVEAYTFDKSTGEFVEKDSVIGKNYMVISEILYRIYNSYDYTNLIPEEAVTEAVTETTEPVTDINGNPVYSAVEQTTTQQSDYYDEDYYDYNDYYDYDGYYDYDDYYGYDKQEEDDGIPDDEYGFGTVIYESPCCFTANGFTFFYTEDDGYVTEITIPWEVVDRLEDSKSVTAE